MTRAGAQAVTDIKERLRNSRRGLDPAERDEAAAEIERLQTDLAILKRHYNLHPDAPLSREETIAAKDAEIERLRSALEMIIDDTYDEAAKTIARRALEPKP